MDIKILSKDAVIEIDGVPYHHHPNGGGLVASTADVAETAFIARSSETPGFMERPGFLGLPRSLGMRRFTALLK
jgi:hypothetical protein